MENNFPANLRAAMLSRGITQADLAKASRLTQGAISKYLSGKQEPKSRELCALALALDVTMDVLYSNKNVPDENAHDDSFWKTKSQDAERKLERLRRAFRKITDVVNELEGAL